MSASVSTRGFRLRFNAAAFLGLAARSWFAVAFTGQLIFAFAVASFYGSVWLRSAPLAMNQTMTHGHVAGQPVGNLVVILHLMMAVIVTTAAVVQLLPGLRARWPRLHRWNGRVFIVAAFGVSLAGLYMLWFRGAFGDLWAHLAATLDALLIMLFASLALRHAVARNFAAHRGWALRLFMVISGSWFVRIIFGASSLIGFGLTGHAPAFGNTEFNLMSFGEYLLPLSVLELYVRIKDHGGTAPRVALAAGLWLLTALTGLGIAAQTFGDWLPKLQTAYAGHDSVDELLGKTITSQGIGAATIQYAALRAGSMPALKPSEADLNNLGYELLRAGRLPDAIAIFRLNTTSYPKSGNVYDSLAEAYMDSGNNALAIAFYQKSLQLDPANQNAVEKLRQLQPRGPGLTAGAP